MRGCKCVMQIITFVQTLVYVVLSMHCCLRSGTSACTHINTHQHGRFTCKQNRQIAHSLYQQAPRRGTDPSTPWELQLYVCVCVCKVCFRHLVPMCSFVFFSLLTWYKLNQKIRQNNSQVYILYQKLWKIFWPLRDKWALYIWSNLPKNVQRIFLDYVFFFLNI